ncbi:MULTISPECIES: hypothetical protein [unclassified Streptomyces]|uniref:hypothetical protein n=1 Tax=unclassified Streptomyces TaxID=2593676 RepID=UPI002E160720|nr:MULTISPECIES: hypothetical protein [unclassified Streptomyces]WSR25778.1 hypothetical protein OG573_06270 [Streptomyces sp. NBC_01205]
MTVCAIEITMTARFTIAADGSYAARLAGDGEARYPERWTLAGPEPYAVPLPLAQPEEADSEVLALTDGRVLIHRRVAERHAFALLYPTGGAAAGPRTGELPLGSVEPGAEGVRVSLLPPSPDGHGAFALAASATGSTVWQVAGGPFGPVARIPGRCTGGVWLDRAGRMLALDREFRGTTKAVAVDLGRGGEVSPLLQIADGSDDRLLLADPDSGLLLIRSDAPGEPRLGWGVLGSSLPVRFPECLRGEAGIPFAVQPGQALMPETCAVALRLENGGIGLWRPADRHVFRLAAPDGWLGTGLWSREGRLHLPYATPEIPCGITGLTLPVSPPAPVRLDPPPAAAPRPVPLQQAPLH